MEELFRDYWWLMFPIFGMVMAVRGQSNEFARQERILRDAENNLERRP
ncbi:MAG TPA: hypothetical protein PLS69_11315 [Terricaulis sp.]|nr:hypothetical protein [Terricaulis sp.]HRP11725.1 hypothetical protein [Terricaulis sp.]